MFLLMTSFKSEIWVNYVFDKSLKFLSIFLHGIRAEALCLQLIVGTAGLLSCWARVLVFFNNLYIGRPYLDVTCTWWRKSETFAL